MRKERQQLVFPREVLLVEIERHCADCNARMRTGLTKAEARLYHGYECERCERWNEDTLTERDIPDWWEELTVTGLEMLRAAETSPESETSGVVVRLSEAWRRKRLDAGQKPDGGDEQV